MSFWDRYILVKVKGERTSFITTSPFSKSDTPEVKLTKIATDFGYEESEIDYFTENLDQMTLDNIVDIIESTLEEENYHSLSSLPGNLSKRLLKTHNPAVVRTVIIALGAELNSMI